MIRCAVLLRGINVGGHRKLPMKELREALRAEGFGGVATYIQSGNVVLEAESLVGLAERLSALIARRWGWEDVPVIVRSAEALNGVIARYPFADPDAAPTLHHVGFLAGPPSEEALARLREKARSWEGTERFAADGAEAFLTAPDGFGKSKLGGDRIERLLGQPTTWRNWRTVLRLRDMLAERSG